MKNEIELKLAFAGNALAALKRHPLVGQAPKAGNAVTLENTYYDTPDLTLKSKGIALRTRRQGRNWLQTVKSASTSTGGLTSRPEWEQPFNGSFDFAAIDAPRVRKLLTRYASELVPVFSTRFRRETRIYESDGKARILMMIDTGKVVAGEHHAPIRELELELDRGTALDLLLLARRIVSDVPLIPDDVSKAERGYRLHLGQQPAAVRARPSSIDPCLGPVDAFRELAFACIRQWQANAIGAGSSDDPEFLHQLRVSLRRLRSLIGLFAPALPADFVSEWRSRLRDNANSLGNARDLDVLYDEILSPVAGANALEDAALAKLQALIREARDLARAQVRTDLDPAAQGRLLVEFMTALHTLPTDHSIGTADLRTFANLRLSRLRKKARKRHAAARSLKPETLHALRIALKQLRYAVEFFAPLMPRKATERYLKTLVKAQTALGFINDLDVARTRLALHAGEDPELRSGAAFVCGWHGPRYARLTRRSIRELDPILGRDVPWKNPGSSRT